MQKYLAFIKTVETGNLTKAAEQLGYTQSGISHMLNSLEEELGFSLLIRNRSGVYLTSNGELIYPILREISQQYTRLQQVAAEICGMQTGIVRIGTFTSVAIKWLPRIMRGFKEEFPNIQLQIRDAAYYEEVEEWLERGMIDCGFTVETSRKTFLATPLIEDRLLAILPSGHPLCSYEKLPLAAFRNETFILPSEGAHHDVGKLLEHSSILAKSSLSTSSDYAAIAMVKNGLGISILPELVLNGYPMEGVEIRELEKHRSRTIYIATQALKYVSPATQRFVDYVRCWVAAQI